MLCGMVGASQAMGKRGRTDGHRPYCRGQLSVSLYTCAYSGMCNVPLTELLVVNTYTRGHRQGTKLRQQITEIFQTLDIDGGGSLDVQEFRRFMRNVRLYISGAERMYTCAWLFACCPYVKQCAWLEAEAALRACAASGMGTGQTRFTRACCSFPPRHSRRWERK